MKRLIGVYGGSFDPIHSGHLRFAELARYIFNLEKIIFIPSYIFPHKYKKNALASFEHRFNMVKLSIMNNKCFEISDIEGNREKKSYTLDTLKILKNKYIKHKIIFMLGSDSLLHIKTWKNWEQLLKEFQHIVALRPGDREKKVFNFVKILNVKSQIIKQKRKPEKIYNLNLLLDDSLIEISSSQIKEYIQKNIPTRYLVPESVFEYIKNNKIYYKED